MDDHMQTTITTPTIITTNETKSFLIFTTQDSLKSYLKIYNSRFGESTFGSINYPHTRETFEGKKSCLVENSYF